MMLTVKINHLIAATISVVLIYSYLYRQVHILPEFKYYFYKDFHA